MTDNPGKEISGRGDPPGRPYFEPDDGFCVSVPVFYGPIDLLLYLIKKNELDIHEISLAEIAREYLEYVELIKLVNLEYAGEFIATASALMKIKSRSLFQSYGEEGGDTQDEDDTERTLIRYLLEYEKLGGAVEKLAEREALRRGVYPRAGEKGILLDQYARRDNAPDYVLFDLLSALRDVLSTAPKTAAHEVELFPVTSEMKQREILEAIAREGRVDFIQLVKGRPRLVIVITFIAILELIKNGKIRIRQSSQFGRITLYDHTRDKSEDT
jgi:segregation and condensation protein A